MPLNLEEFGRRLRAVRTEKDLTQDELAQLITAPRTWISELEHGRQKSLRADTVVRFAEALGVSADYLLGLADDPYPPRRRRPRRTNDASERMPTALALAGT
jgi:transcriptional regulator with XRE-family HTH domain